MGVEKIVRKIGEYLKGDVDVDLLEGPYVVKGIFMNDVPPVERIEVGETFETGYKPAIQLRSDPDGTKIEKRKTSYLGVDNFSGSAFQPALAGKQPLTEAIQGIGGV